MSTGQLNFEPRLNHLDAYFGKQTLPAEAQQMLDKYNYYQEIIKQEKKRRWQTAQKYLPKKVRKI